VDPPALSSALLTGEHETRTLSLTNGGGSPMEFRLALRPLQASGAGPVPCTATTALVSDFADGRLLQVDLGGGGITTVVSGLTSPNKGLVLDSTGTLAWVTESQNGTIARVDLAAGTVDRIGRSFKFPNGLALLDDGPTAYLTQTETGLLSQVDLDSGVATTLAAGLDLPNGIALDPGSALVYVAEYGGGEISSVDPSTGTIGTVATGLGAPNALAVDATGSRLYVAEVRTDSISLVDPATGAASPVALLPETPGSLALDPDGTSLWVTGTGTGAVLRVDLATGSVTPVAGGMVMPVGIALQIPPACRERVVRVTPASGVVPPFGSTLLHVTFDPGRLPAGDYPAEIDIATNDPATPLVTVPAALHLTGIPKLAIEPIPAVVESVRGYFSPGAATDHDLPLSAPLPGAAVIELEIEGDYGDWGELATLSAEGIVLGSVGELDSDCSSDRVGFPVSAAELAVLAADGVISATVQNTEAVETICPINRHTVRLRYTLPMDPLEFGPVFVGFPRERSFLTRNDGTEILEMDPIATDRAEFTVTPQSLTLAPYEAREVVVRFAPPGAGPVAGALSLASNDPGRPSTLLALSGEGVVPPVIGFQPASISASLEAGELESRILTLSNSGGSDLAFSLAEGPGGGGANLSGLFQPLAGSPLPLTCVVGDQDSGILYAQANEGTEFYRYVAALDGWESLSPAPLSSGNNGGAALLNGKIYTAYTLNESDLGVYEINTDSWSTLPHPLGTATGNIAGDGVRYLYLIHGERLVRFDPAAGAVTGLANPPFFFEAWGGLRHHEGILYAHRGNGLAEFAAYAIASDTWRVLPALPSGAVLGAAIDPARRTYLAYGSYGANNLYEYSIDRNQWTVRAIPLFSVNDGGLAWLDDPIQGIFMVEGEGGTGVARLLTAPPFLILEPPSGTVPAGGSLDVNVTLDTSALLAGIHQSAVEISSNDPASPSNRVPVTLDLSGRPDIAVAATTFSLPSTRSYSTAGPTTSHALILPEPPAAGATLHVTVDGDYGESAEKAIVRAEGRVIGALGSTGMDCTSASATFPLGDALVADLAADGVIHVEIDAEDGVDPYCTTNLHAVEFVYTQPVNPVAFGDVFLGYERTRSFVLENRGTDDLHVSSIVSSLPEVTVTAGALILPPGASRPVVATFHPTVTGPLSAALTVHSDDPDMPAMAVLLSGTGLIAPVVGVQPASMSSTLFAGDRETRSLTLTNGGGSDLIWSLSLDPGSPPFLSIQPSSGAIPAGASLTVEVILDTFGLSAGSASGRIDVTSNDPATPVVPVPVSLTVIAAPNIEVSRKTDLSSTKDFSGTGTLTRHELIPPRPPTGRGTFRLEVDGDFGDPIETAALSLEGIPVGILGGTGSDCSSSTATFSVDPFLLSSSAADGVIRATVQNSQNVNDFCPVNRHTLSLSYPFSIDPVEFGVTLVDTSSTIEAIIGNLGTEDLVITSITVDPPEFSASPSSATLAPGQEEPLRLSFAPEVPGPVSGLLTLSSNDPDEAVVAIALTGTGVEPPVVEVQPPSLTSVVDEGGADSQTLTILNRGGSDLTFTLSAGSATFMTLSPDGGTVAPGGILEIVVTLSSAGLDRGVHQGALSMASNDPAVPLLVVPVLFLVRGTPVIKVTTDSQEIALSSSQSFTRQGAWTLHRLEPAPAPTSQGVLTVTVEGDFGGSSHSATVTSEGALIGTVGPSGTGCTRVSRSFVVSLSLLRFLAGDRAVRMRVLNSALVQPSCPVNRHSVELRYPAVVPSRMDFEETFVGGTRSRIVTIESIGTDILDVSLTSPATEFSTSPSTLNLFPGDSSEVAVTFAPASATAVSGVLSIHSNDPGDPVHTLTLTGTGVPPPVAVLAEDSFEIAVPTGGAAARSVHLSNAGQSDLIWEIEAEPPGWLSFSPPAGVVAPGDEIEILLTMDAASIPDGDHTAVVTILNNDPLNGRVEIPVLLHAGEAAVDQILVEPGTLNLSSRGKTVRVWFQLPAPFDPREILISTVSLNGLLPPKARPVDFVDENHDGVEEVVLKFDRAAVEAILPEGDRIPVTVTGEVRNRTWFTGTAAIRVIRSQAVDP
jgi:sugar lactone lactonase YvrE